MATSLNVRTTRSTGQDRQFGFALALILAALASLAAAALSTAGGLSGGTPVPGVASIAVPAAGLSEPAAIKPTPVVSRAMAQEVANVEFLAEAAARRYRISSDAMHELVTAAYAEARRNRLDPLLIIAVMAIESRFNPIAQSDAGATGLMQVIPEVHADKFAASGSESALDPRTNIKVGAQVLREYIARGGNEVAGLQLYNGASGDAANTFANKVLAERERLRTLLQRARDLLAAGTSALGHLRPAAG